MCDSPDLTLDTVLLDGIATIRQTLPLLMGRTNGASLRDSPGYANYYVAERRNRELRI